MRKQYCSLPNLLNFALATILVVAFGGCAGEEIEVHKNQLPTRPIGTQGVRSPDTRMIVTIHNRENEMWFFRVTDDEEVVDKTEKSWRPFVEEIEFENDEPVFDLPEGWKEGKRSQFRYATLITNSEPPVEIIVSRLPQGQDLISNVNRWRGQLSLAPIKANPEEHIKPLKAGDESILYFDSVGIRSGGGMGGTPPFASSAGTSANTPQVKISYDVPKDWNKVSDGAGTTKYEKKVDALKVQISFTKLPPNVVDWPDVVKMWGAQLGENDLEQDQIKEMTKSVKVDNSDANQVQLNSKDETQTIIGLMVEHESAFWFVKMAGDKSLVEKESEKFQTMVESIKFD